MRKRIRMSFSFYFARNFVSFKILLLTFLMALSRGRLHDYLFSLCLYLKLTSRRIFNRAYVREYPLKYMSLSQNQPEASFKPSRYLKKFCQLQIKQSVIWLCLPNIKVMFNCRLQTYHYVNNNTFLENRARLIYVLILQI